MLDNVLLDCVVSCACNRTALCLGGGAFFSGHGVCQPVRVKTRNKTQHYFIAARFNPDLFLVSPLIKMLCTL